MKYQSKLNEKKREDNQDTEKGTSKESSDGNGATDVDKVTATVRQRSNSIEEIEIVDRSARIVCDVKCQEPGARAESRKRFPDESSSDNTKRIKLSNVSHLQLMQDVVALIDDLISKVCDMVSQKERPNESVTILSSDESNEPRLQKKKKKQQQQENTSKPAAEVKLEESKRTSMNLLTVDSERKTDNVQDLMDALMKQAMEISQETQQSSADDEDTRKFDGKWLQNEDLQSTVRLQSISLFVVSSV